MSKINISAILSQAWELTKKNWLSVLAALVIIIIVEQIISSLFGPSTTEITRLTNRLAEGGDVKPEEFLTAYQNMMISSGPSGMISRLVSIILSVGLYRIILNAVQGKGEFTINAWKQSANTYVKFVVTDIIVGIIVAIGFFLCILPGIYLYARLQFACYFLLEHEEASIGDAISASWNMTRDDAFNLCLLFIVFFFIIVAGLLCCCVGVILSEIICYLATGVAFYALLPKKLEDAPATVE